MKRKTMMTELPFDYHKCRSALFSRQNAGFDEGLEDRYHDCLEKFLKHWNGVGDPIGAMFLYWNQWYKDKDYRKKLPLISLTLPGSQEDEETQYDVPVPDMAHWMVLNDDVQKVLSTCTDRQLEILALRMDNVEFRVIGERYGISHQAVQDSYSKVVRKILAILNP